MLSTRLYLVFNPQPPPQLEVFRVFEWFEQVKMEVYRNFSWGLQLIHSRLIYLDIYILTKWAETSHSTDLKNRRICETDVERKWKQNISSLLFYLISSLFVCMSSTSSIKHVNSEFHSHSSSPESPLSTSLALFSCSIVPAYLNSYVQKVTYSVFCGGDEIEHWAYMMMMVDDVWDEVENFVIIRTYF